MDDRPFRILCVCTANICRSPVAERLLAGQLGATVQVSSAGTFGLIDSPMAEPMATRLRESGLDSGGFIARRLTSRDVADAELILGLTTGHRRDAVELVPSAVRRSFTLREFARLISALDPSMLPSGTPASRLRASVPLVTGFRRRGHADDIDDPFGRSDAAYQRAFEEIDEATREIAAMADPDQVPDQLRTPCPPVD